MYFNLNIIRLQKDFLVCKPKQTKSHLCQAHFTYFVSFLLFGCKMILTIYFYNQLLTQTNKIHYIIINNILPMKNDS